jgi:hypothetical protein
VADGEVIKDDCTICNIVLLAAAVGAALMAGYMLVDLFTDGKLTAGISGTFAGKLASVTDIAREDGPSSDAG